MWRKEDGSPQTSPEASSSPMTSTTAGRAGGSKAAACVSQGIKIKGELTGSEDLFIDGAVDGKITLSNSTLTVGPNGTVKAEIAAREVVLRGRAEGKFTASERVQIWHTARVQGDIKAERISIEDGAELHGRLEAGKSIGSAPATDSSGHHGKKSESGKAKDKDANQDEEKSPSGAATAGAD
jgi:cytoskeletal protein CcmA (bactofilin family)